MLCKCVDRRSRFEPKWCREPDVCWGLFPKSFGSETRKTCLALNTWKNNHKKGKRHVQTDSRYGVNAMCLKALAEITATNGVPAGTPGASVCAQLSPIICSGCSCLYCHLVASRFCLVLFVCLSCYLTLSFVRNFVPVTFVLGFSWFLLWCRRAR